MPPLPYDPKIADLLDEIYQSAITPEMWENLPERLAKATGGGAWAMQLVRQCESQGTFAHGVNFDPALMEAYPDHYAAMNPWLPALRRTPVLQLVHDWQIVQNETLLKSEFYADFLKPQGDIHRGFGMVLVRGEIGGLVVSCNYAPGEAESIGTTGSQLLSMVGPHLRRAFDLTRLVERSAMRAGAQVMDGIAGPHACFALDSRSRLVACDARGEALLSEGTILKLGRDRRLRFIEDSANTALDDRLEHEGRVGRGFVVPGPGTDRMLARLAPLPRPQTIAPLEMILSTDRAVAALIVTEPGQPGARDEDLQELFDLTPAESTVLRELCAGQTLAEIAAMRGVSLNTVRNQMGSLFDKTGARRQAELVALVARMVA